MMEALRNMTIYSDIDILSIILKLKNNSIFQKIKIY